MHAYYEHKLAEGKAKMSVLNAVMNKLVHLAFALVRKDEMFEAGFRNKLSNKAEAA
jgi:transposase